MHVYWLVNMNIGDSKIVLSPWFWLQYPTPLTRSFIPGPNWGQNPTQHSSITTKCEQVSKQPACTVFGRWAKYSLSTDFLQSKLHHLQSNCEDFENPKPRAHIITGHLQQWHTVNLVTRFANESYENYNLWHITLQWLMTLVHTNYICNF